MNYRKFFLRARPSLIFSFVSMLLLACGLGFASITYFNASPTPTSAQIESAGVLAINAQTPASMASLSQWAQQGMPAAQRELGLVLASAGTDLPQAVSWLNKAALAGDNEAQFVLAEAHYKAKLGVPQNYALAWKWYAAAAMQENTKASFMLARMAKYGEGAPLDLALSVHYLQQASEAGNAQAMFLLSNAYAVGEGVAKNADLTQKWLEKSAEGDYPVAIHELALSLTANQDQAGENALAARHLIKEANDERSLRWNRYQ
ncbi:tetratricopeptide repeat protein [Undibacterium parvum]|uniref:tetratricopeptide repeat protein n=1 Tax=Undibacterium parvum TaxID=401471 RepID=UPI00147730D6|nr:tetratricopeptide repeat protein [Undibacterium parvum]